MVGARSRIGASSNLVRVKVYNTGGNSPWEARVVKKKENKDENQIEVL